MKIVALVSSYRKKGNTARMVEMILTNLAAQVGEQEALEIETIFLGHSHVALCRGCRICFDRGEGLCPIKDDLLPIKTRLQAADLVIAASPVYVDDVNGTMKNWIDRMAHLCHRPGLAGKYVYLVATSGTTPTARALTTLTTAFSTWGAAVVGQAGFITGALMPAAELETRYQGKTGAIASQILRAIRGQSARNPSFRALITFKIQQLAWQRNQKPSYDQQYWDRQGWTDASRNYFIPHRANPLKVALARLTGSILALFYLKS